jgi:hypothetical protein
VYWTEGRASFDAVVAAMFGGLIVLGRNGRMVTKRLSATEKEFVTGTHRRRS